MTMPTDNSEAPDLRVARRVLAAGGDIGVAIAKPQPIVTLFASVAFDAGGIVRDIESLPKTPFRITYT